MTKGDAIFLISVSSRGRDTSIQLAQALQGKHQDIRLYTLAAYKIEGVAEIKGDVSTFVKSIFYQAKAIIFCCAMGIVVRSIAPYLKGKDVDPAVLCMDEKGAFVIPVISGHLGGANSLARQVARLIKGKAIITTATDINHEFAIDEWSVQQHCLLEPLAMIKRFSATLLEKGCVGINSEFPVEKPLPQGLSWEAEDIGMVVTARMNYRPFKKNLLVHPQVLHVGIGCRAGISKQQIDSAFFAVVDKFHLSTGSVKALHTIDIKKDEVGLSEFASSWHWPIYYHSAEMLKKVKGSKSSSSFVTQTVGVDNVCERAALCGIEGKLIVEKQKHEGVTIAIVQEDYMVLWSKEESICRK
ncbi:cobalt-precorrin 5A hydrolase [Megasphaera hutchinsoni]|uniref:CbiG protein n=1 Tax=Megasphaera hutchinsoni TaxID=1588748 RepID=A0A134CF82_9FIRM|nr:cobalamin biosynthesis protein [Megasphaera hutchinsoni]KXB90849.1 CbiG protein [Megasphaera hutchinsoni]